MSRYAPPPSAPSPACPPAPDFFLRTARRVPAPCTGYQVVLQLPPAPRAPTARSVLLSTGAPPLTPSDPGLSSEAIPGSAPSTPGRPTPPRPSRPIRRGAPFVGASAPWPYPFSAAQGMSDPPRTFERRYRWTGHLIETMFDWVCEIPAPDPPRVPGPCRVWLREGRARHGPQRREDDDDERCLN